MFVRNNFQFTVGEILFTGTQQLGRTQVDRYSSQHTPQMHCGRDIASSKAR